MVPRRGPLDARTRGVLSTEVVPRSICWLYRGTQKAKPNQNNNKDKQTKPKTMCKTKGARHSGQSVKYTKLFSWTYRYKFLSGQHFQSRRYLEISLDCEVLKGRDLAKKCDKIDKGAEFPSTILGFCLWKSSVRFPENISVPLSLSVLPTPSLSHSFLGPGSPGVISRSLRTTLWATEVG